MDKVLIDEKTFNTITRNMQLIKGFASDLMDDGPDEFTAKLLYMLTSETAAMLNKIDR
ncbi:MAG: hypothetical protein PUG48_11345 [Clostridia bacterium]|nr:hypothetical protein [Clostridia bacterium]